MLIITVNNNRDQSDRKGDDCDQNDQTSVPTQMTATVMSTTFLTNANMTEHVNKQSWALIILNVIYRNNLK